ncbi:MAG: rhomboid family intramembrane serine protease [Opitutales bacterium]|jgi:membrane associated rhomboid family serine protease
MASLKAMESKELPNGLVDFEPDEALVAVAVFDDYVKAGEAGLAILAMGNAYWMILHGERYVICVVEIRYAAVSAELEALAALEVGRVRGARFEYHEFDFGWLSFALYAAVLITCFVWQGRADMVSAGQADSVAMVKGSQWWRAVTALTLHADVVHLVSNLISGLGFAFFVCRFFGAGAGWLLVLLSGIAGNVLNAMVYYPEVHYSIGASTAVFGALGLLTGVGIWAAVLDPDHRLSLPRWLIPVFGGLTLLGLFGVGDGNVDVAAHISGFACGAVFGALGAWVQSWFLVLQRWSIACGALSLGLLALAWYARVGA